MHVTQKLFYARNFAPHGSLLIQTQRVYSVNVVRTACGLTSHLELIKAQEVSVRGDVTGYWGYGVVGVRLVTSRGTR